MSNIHKAEKIPAEKKEVVKKISDLIKKYPIIGALNMENLPAAQLQRMKANLRESVVMFMAKRRLIKLAIEQAKSDKKGIEKIDEYLRGMPALLFTNENPFKLFKILKKSKSKAPAKAGQTAPADIVVKAGPTPFAPGPVISELAQLGIKSKVEAGKIAIVQDTVVCKEGGVINDKLAGMLLRLGIEPMQIGLDLVAVYEKGDIFTKSVLDIDDAKFMADLSKAASWAFNLSVEAAFVTSLNREMLIQKAFRESKALAVSQGILADAAVGDILAKAEREMNSLKSMMPELPPAAKAPEQPKAEEKKEEEKPKEIPEKVKEPKPEVDKKVENIVQQAKMNAKGKSAAEALVEEAKNEPKKEGEKSEVEQVEELTKKLMKKGTLRK